MKHIYRNLITIFILFSTFVAVGQIQYSNEFWISTNANGNIYPGSLGTSGGTLANPLDGSTEANFDNNMQHLPANSTIHIMPGTYQEDGNGWLKTGQKIKGSGIDVTILQLDPNAYNGAGVIFSEWDGNVTNCDISDLTLDANGSPGKARVGLALSGTENILQRLKLINTSTDGTNEIWGLLLDSYSCTAPSFGNIIENCEISQYLGGPPCGQADMNAINIISGGGPSISGIIRDNQIIASPPTIVFALNAEFNSLIEGNYVQGADVGMYNDSGIATNVIVTHNIFNNVRAGLELYNATHQNMTFSYNTILLSTNLPFQTAFSIGDGLSTNFNIIGNTVGWAGTPTGAGYFLVLNDIQGLVIADNRVDASLNNNISSESAYNCIIRDNYDLLGNYLSINLPTVGNTPVTSLGLNLIGSSLPGSVLMDLGLPGDPTVIVTNGEAQSVNLSSLSVANGATITNGLTVHGNASISGETDLGGAQYTGGFALSALGLSGNSTVAEFLSSTNDYDSTIVFGDQNHNNNVYIGVVKDSGYDSFEILNGSGSTNNPIAVFNENAYGGNGYIGIETNNPSEALTVAGNILATGTNYATQFIGGGAGITGLNPANISTGTAAINISGNSATASAATNVVGIQSLLTVTNLSVGMETSTGGTPTVTSASPNVTNVSVTGHDRAFRVTFSGLGSVAVAGGTNFFSVTFSNTNYTSVPLVVWQSANLNAANLIYNIGQPYISSSSKTNFVFAVDIVGSGAWGAGSSTTNCTMTFLVNQ